MQNERIARMFRLNYRLFETWAEGKLFVGRRTERKQYLAGEPCKPDSVQRAIRETNSALRRSFL